MTKDTAFLEMDDFGLINTDSEIDQPSKDTIFSSFLNCTLSCRAGGGGSFKTFPTSGREELESLLHSEVLLLHKWDA